MKKKIFKQHYSGLWVANDGEVFVPKSGTNPAHYTYGTDNGNGYRIVCYKGKKYRVHRLVAETYIPNNENKPDIDHINTNRSDNRVENLRWCTQGENQNNPITRDNLSESQKIPVVGTHMETGITVEFESAKDAWLTLNIDRSHITKCCKGKLKSAGGYYWSYLT